jgi:hypothetical protein
MFIAQAKTGSQSAGRGVEREVSEVGLVLFCLTLGRAFYYDAIQQGIALLRSGVEESCKKSSLQNR